jgi:hypothetical protein
MPRLASHGAVAARGHGGQNRYNREPWRHVSYDDRRRRGGFAAGPPPWAPLTQAR